MPRGDLGNAKECTAYDTITTRTRTTLGEGKVKDADHHHGTQEEQEKDCAITVLLRWPAGRLKFKTG